MKTNKEKIEKFSITEIEPLIDSIIKRYNLTEEGLCKRLRYNEGYISQLRSREKTTGMPQVSLKFINQLKSLSGLQNATNENESKQEKNAKITGHTPSGQIVLVEAKDITASYERIIEEKERMIKLIEAQTEKLERDKDRLFRALDEAQRTINEVLKPIKETTEQITANSDQNRDQVLQMIQLLQEQTYIVSTQLEHQREALGLGYPGQKQKQPVPFVKTGKGSVLPRREDANKGKGG